MNLLLPGMYVSISSPVHRLDPRVKMTAALLLMMAPFAAPGLMSSLLLAAFVALLAYLSDVPWRPLLRTLRTVLWLGVFLSIFYLFTTPGRVLLSCRGLSLTLEGLAAAATQVFRLCLLVTVSSLLTFTTSPAQLTHGLETLFQPLDRLGLPVREAAMVLSLSLRFVPTLFDQVERIIKAQRSRGAVLESGPPWQRIRSWIPIFVPIFVAAFRRADDLAVAMDARGFRGVRQRTHLRQLRLGWRDLYASLIVLGAGIAAWALDRFM
jgi:energy-coupling factor transport system permease protein